MKTTLFAATLLVGLACAAVANGQIIVEQYPSVVRGTPRVVYYGSTDYTPADYAPSLSDTDAPSTSRGTQVVYSSSPEVVYSQTSQIVYAPQERVVERIVYSPASETVSAGPYYETSGTSYVVGSPVYESGISACGTPVSYSSYMPVASTPYVAYSPIVPIVPAYPNVVVGRGIIGQPKAYVPGQPLRNAIRFVTP
jgi:hypothetical protein